LDIGHDDFPTKISMLADPAFPETQDEIELKTNDGVRKGVLQFLATGAPSFLPIKGKWKFGENFAVDKDVIGMSSRQKQRT
jgi:hypothetical protein